jgi:SAM-dependent methyltransferase
MSPAPGDPFYLHLADLLLALGSVASQKILRVLDFGCGGSPYRVLFPNAKYDRADLAGTPSIDVVLGADSKLSVKDSTYDLVLSTQVLEHVLDPHGYLSEAFRVLREGGDLVLTTHGSFYDHGCPHDYFRWTAEGLRSSLEAVGFQVVSVKKLTAGPRALMFLLRHYEKLLLSAGFSWGSLCLRVLRLPFRLRPDLLDKFIDRRFSDYRICDGDQHQYSFYIALIAIARRAPTGNLE